MTTEPGEADWRHLKSAHYNLEFRRWLLGGHADRLLTTSLPTSARAMGVDALSAWVPEGFRQEIIRAMTAHSVMRGVSRVIEDDAGGDRVIGFLDDTANVGRILSEHSQATETDFAVGVRRIPLFAFSSDIIRASIQLIQDAEPLDFEEWLVETLGERVARLVNQVATVGSGANSPQGLATAAVVGVTGAAGQTATVTHADLVALKASVGSAYVYGPNGQGNWGRWMMNASTLQAVEALLDGSGQPLVRQDAAGQAPPTLLGHRVAVNSDMPNMAAGAKPILFGDYRAGYVVRDGPVIVTRLAERYAEYAQVAFHLAARCGSQLVDAAAVRAYQNATA